MVYQIIACHKDGQTEQQVLSTVTGTVLTDGRKELGEFVHLNNESVSTNTRY